MKQLVLLAILAISCAHSAPRLPQGKQLRLGELTGVVEMVSRGKEVGVLPGATVTLKDVQSNRERAVTTGLDGVYRFENVLFGEYTVRAELERVFYPNTRDLLLASSVQLDIKLVLIEGPDESVTVEPSTHPSRLDQ